MINLIIGIDLSFNSTGITITEITNNIAKNISFYRLVYDDNSNKFKKYTPTYIKNINQQTYRLPTNILVKDIIQDNSDFYSEDQAIITLKAMVCSKRILDIIVNKIKKYSDKINLYINIEGFIMPSITGIEQFKGLSGLIMLQGILRCDLIKIKLLKLNIDNLKIYITSPSDLKKWFTGNGSADKLIMLQSFKEIYNGNILIPNTDSLNKINDVVDSFALCLNCIAKINNLVEVKIKIKKKKKIKKIPINIIKNSIPNN